MNLPQVQDSPAQRRIALVERGNAGGSGAEERAQHAMRLLDTMLWVLKGTTRDTWATATPDEADIVVVHRDDAATLATTWKARGKLVVEITHDPDATGVEGHVLAYPFPAKRVLELLEKLSGQLDARAKLTPVAAGARSAPVVNSDRWALLESLRTLRAVRNDNLWLVAREGTDPVLWLRGDGSAFFATQNWLRTLHEDSSLIARLELRDGYPPPKSRVVERPGAELFWYSGFNAGEILAPWLSTAKRYRVGAWPDFGVIRPDASALRLVALLAAEPLDLKTLAARGRVSVAQASRMLNALSLCEVLIADESAVARRGEAGIVQPRGGFAGFLRRLRSHLGIGAEA